MALTGRAPCRTSAQQQDIGHQAMHCMVVMYPAHILTGHLRHDIILPLSLPLCKSQAMP
jgi:hypothetical protein